MVETMSLVWEDAIIWCSCMTVPPRVQGAVTPRGPSRRTGCLLTLLDKVEGRYLPRTLWCAGIASKKSRGMSSFVRANAQTQCTRVACDGGLLNGSDRYAGLKAEDLNEFCEAVIDERTL